MEKRGPGGQGKVPAMEAIRKVQPEEQAAEMAVDNRRTSADELLLAERDVEPDKQ